MKQRNRVYIRVLMVIMAIVVLLVFTNRGPQQRQHRDTWLPSSYNPVGAGSMALFDTLEDLHWPIDRWREPLSRLGLLGPGNVLIITRSKFGSPPVTFTDEEDTLLQDWVKQGNTLVLLGALGDWDDTRDLLRRLGFGVPDRLSVVSDFWQAFETPNQTPRALTAMANSGFTGTLVLPKCDPLPNLLPRGASVLFQDRGDLYLVAAPLGAGHIVCGASDELLSSAWLQKGDNLAIVLKLLAPDGRAPTRLLFEESHHGFSAVYAIIRLLNDPGVRFAGLLALLGALAYFAGSLVRFGPILPRQRPVGRSTLEFVDSIADLYLRADQRDATVRSLFAETHQQVLQRLNLPPTAPHELIASRLEQAHPHLPKWKKLAHRFDSPDYVQGLPPTGWLRVAKDLIEIKTALA